jgi:hypothetical protein
MVFMLGPSESCCISGLYGIAGVSEGTFCHYSPAALVKFTLNLSRRRWYLRVISALAWPSCFWTKRSSTSALLARPARKEWPE